MRAAFLPILVAALSVLSPIAAQAPGDTTDTGSTDTSTDTGADTGTDTGAGAVDTGAGAVDTGSATDAGPSATDSADPSTETDTNNSGSTTSGTDGIAPSEPSADTVVNIGDQITAMWDINTDGTQWTNMTIELMTGSDWGHISLSVVGKNINAMTGNADNTGSYSFVAPAVHPTSKIYFLRFTTIGNTQMLYTTRFTIAGKDGSTVPPASNSTNDAGETVFYGIGALDSTGNGTTLAPTPTAPVATGTGPNGITIYTQGINTGTIIPSGVLAGVSNAKLGAGASSRAPLAPAAALGAIIAAAAFLA